MTSDEYAEMLGVTMVVAAILLVLVLTAPLWISLYCISRFFVRNDE